jgi:hypothetical protein
VLAGNPTALPLQAVALALLLAALVLAALPAVADWCSASDWSPRAVTAAHLAVMLLPPLLPLRLGTEARRLIIAMLLFAGGAALWLQPSLQGLMTAALLQGTAWGLGWGGLLGTPRVHANAVAPSSAQSGAVAALLLWAMGWVLHHGGPAALVATHALLALCGAMGLVAGPYKFILARLPHRYP